MRENESLNSRLSLICSHRVTVPSGYGGREEEYIPTVGHTISPVDLIRVSLQAPADTGYTVQVQFLITCIIAI